MPSLRTGRARCAVAQTRGVAAARGLMTRSVERDMFDGVEERSLNESFAGARGRGSLF